ncbi:hypothetical protein P20652_3714 [Pseudoalteromonas sp. BSi20652]|uniref:hypothetical protein n=1 Tax=Pseudoalteromonas sp. BSi20652 TaxID=388384 RepID=UPI0002318C27|nr:hypothetical protein [Pseudoalteromonas sp. BSi20652]GAA61825.1 hypothetical protein P20652_3714 [Pseudoalteromonas sp. BSi20652]
MPVNNQKYALVTNEGWESSLNERWSNAPLVGGYRLLVFSGSDLPKLEAEYSDTEFKYLTVEDTIEAMNAGEIGPFICNINQAREIVAHFNPPQPDTNQENNHAI